MKILSCLYSIITLIISLFTKLCLLSRLCADSNILLFNTSMIQIKLLDLKKNIAYIIFIQIIILFHIIVYILLNRNYLKM